MMLEKPKRIVGPADQMPFGKFRGLFVSDLLAKETNYMMWAIVNMDSIEFTDEVKQTVMEWIAADTSGKRKRQFVKLVKTRKDQGGHVPTATVSFVPAEDDDEIIDLENMPAAVPAEHSARYAGWGDF